MQRPILLLLIVLLFMGLDQDHIVQTRFIRPNSNSSHGSSELPLVSDGIYGGIMQLDNDPFLKINHHHDHEDKVVIVSTSSSSSSMTCEPMYGFLPCATNLWGQIFLFLVYQYLLYLGDKCISLGSELILTHRPGVFGASAFHILGSLPEALLVLVSGVYGTKETAQDKVTVGISILAGSTVLLLTLLWGTCGIVEKIDHVVELVSLNEKDGKWFNLIGSGVITTDNKTKYTARIMLVSMIPFVFAQLPHIFGSTSEGRIWTFVSLILSISILVTYCSYQVSKPWIPNRRLEFIINKYVKTRIQEKLLTSDGKPNEDAIEKLFQRIDTNNDNHITHDELKGFIEGIKFEEVGPGANELVDKLMEEFDSSRDAYVDKGEYVRGIKKWLCETQESKDPNKPDFNPQSLLSPVSYKKAERPQYTELDQNKKKAILIKRSLWTYMKAIWSLLFGTFLVTILSEPIIDTVQNISSAANIPSFFIFFIVVPIAVNYREAISAITAIREKSRFSASLTFSEIYSAVFMNNIVGIVTFLGIFYARGFVWNFSAEVLIVLMVCIVIGLYASFSETVPLWTSIVACLLYPVSVVLLYVLTYFLGWG